MDKLGLAIDRSAGNIFEDLAVDEALLIEVEEGRLPPLLRLWEPTEYAVVLGASGRLRENVFVETCRADRVTVARRSSGGGTVILGPGVLNFTVVLPADGGPGFGGIDTAQHQVLEHFAAALETLVPGITVEGSGDLAIHGRKFVGSAQRRLRHHFLIHLSLLNRFALERVGRYLCPPPREPAYRSGRPHDDFLRNFAREPSEIKRVVVEAWCRQGVEWTPGDLPGALIRSLIDEKFGQSSWIERL